MSLTRRQMLAGAGAAALTPAPLSANPAGTAITPFRMTLAEEMAGRPDLAEFYRARGFAPVFTAEDPAARRALLEAMPAARAHALPEARHDPARLIETFAAVRSEADRARAEVAAARAYLAFARDIRSGVIAEPGSVDSGIKRAPEPDQAVTLLTAFADGRPEREIAALPPRSAEYARLMAEKRRLERVISAGGWGPELPARRLEPGDSGRAVVALRDRLVAMGYITATARMRYDTDLTRAVEELQADHGLKVDGVTGEATRAAINRSPEDRLGAILVAMERERWLPRERGARHVLVNIPDFRAMIVDADRVTFATRSVVGKNTRDRRTPEFSDIMEHMIVNPNWYVPRSITVKEYLPQLQENPYAQNQLQVIDGTGRVVPRGAVDFTQYTSRSFPFSLKEPPSRGNALGLVKFRFPNRYNIYLHDTPAKHLFARDRRAFSHGCIRLNEPFDFAYELLRPQAADPEAVFRRALESGQTTQLDLERQVPVHLIYRTAMTTADGRVQYRGDVYGRDARIRAALAEAGVAPGLLSG